MSEAADNENPHGGWDGVNQVTGKKVRIKSSAKLRSRVSPQSSENKQPSTNAISQKQRDTTKRIITKEEYESGNTKPIEVPTDKKLSLINAAEIVLKACERPLSCKEIIEKAIDANIWQPGRGLPPSNTLYASLLREIKTKGTASRFVNAEAGKFIIQKNQYE